MVIFIWQRSKSSLPDQGLPAELAKMGTLTEHLGSRWAGDEQANDEISSSSAEELPGTL
jgi:hypothetical protein